MGEGLLKARLPEINVSSAGIFALIDYPADPHSIALMHEKNIDISNHLARQLDNDLARDADLILTMEKKHNQHIQATFANTTGKVHLIGKWLDNREIPDPVGKNERAFRIAMENIEKGLNAWIERLK